MDTQMLYTDIKYLKGVGEKRANLFKRELGICNYKDLLFYFPYRYVDKTEFIQIIDIRSDEAFAQIKGRIVGKEIIGNNNRLIVDFEDATARVELVFFSGISWINEHLIIGKEYVIFGKPNEFNGSYNFVHPEIEPLSDYLKQENKYIPVYSTTDRMRKAFLNSKAIGKLTRQLCKEVHGHVKETLPNYITSYYHLIPLQLALENMHYPDSSEMLSKAKFRLKFEELFFMQLEHQKHKTDRVQKSDGFVFSKVGNYFNSFYNNNLKFELTDAQKRVIKEIRNDMRSTHQMNRLLQGDVGSGKTLVALMCMLVALDNGFQSALVAPTEILAEQHYNNIVKMLSGLNINVALLTGNVKGKARKNILSNLQEGAIHILIGTHAILEDTVIFHNLGFAVIDEQHRFGVEQRSKMWKKNPLKPPHVLVMTATPIPRTLAMTVYGDLDCSIIDELPPGRKPIQTAHLYDNDILRVYSFMHRQIEQGRQIYVVYPLIKESEKLDLKDLMDGYDSITREFPLPKYQVSIVHGQMKADDKDYEMQRFVQGITNIMVATTVIEVGVDVPNASVMIIQNAERFGLSQLHQLRGRVGRGSSQSFCILMTKEHLSNDSLRRIDIMCSTNDGFVLAQEDLALRGPGSIAGTQQSGVLELKVADIVKDEPIVRMTRDLSISIIQKDPNLQAKDNSLLKEYLSINHPMKDFSKIS